MDEFRRRNIHSLGRTRGPLSDDSESEKIELQRKEQEMDDQHKEASSSRSSGNSGRMRSTNSEMSLSGGRNYQPLNLWAMEDDSEKEILQSEASS